MRKLTGIKMMLQLFAAGPGTTVLSDMINPEVMADMISAKIPNKIVVAPFARVNTDLVGTPGSTITVPQYIYIGDAEDVAEGVEVEAVKLVTTSTSITVKKAMKAVELTDEAVLSGYGDPVGQSTSQLSMAIGAKLDNDAMTALMGARLTYDGSAAVIGYVPIVDAIDRFNEEVNTDKVMFINPKQTTTLRKDANFISADKYPGNTIMTGEIGMIANTRIVPSRKVALNALAPAHYEFCESGDASALQIILDSGTIVGQQVKLATVLPTQPTATVGEWVLSIAQVAAGVYYACPIIKLTGDADTEDETPAIEIYVKRDTNVETERKTAARMTEISVDKHYAVALSNTSKVILARFKK